VRSGEVLQRVRSTPPVPCPVCDANPRGRSRGGTRPVNCAACAAANQTDAIFCEECGASFERSCPSCGTRSSPRAKFCRKCRTPLDGDAVAKSGEPDARSYTPKHLVDKILTSRSALEGGRKQVTILFADVKGSMDLAEQVDPEEWHKIMDRFFAILSEGVHR